MIKLINNVHDVFKGNNTIQKIYSGTSVVFEKAREIIEDSDGVQYYKAEYIENPSTAYINTGVTITTNTSWEIKARKIGSYTSGGHSIFGWRGSTRAFYISINTNKTVYVFHSNLYGNIATGVTITNDHVYAVKGGICYIDGVQKADRSAAKSYTGGAAYLGRYNGSGTNTTSARFYYCKLWNGETLVRDFIPVQRISDSVYGMFDLVNLKFYASANSSVAFDGK